MQLDTSVQSLSPAISTVQHCESKLQPDIQLYFLWGNHEANFGILMHLQLFSYQT